ncbi:MAG: electron transport complex subunit RsxC [Lachnospiraceae bacterium]|nr:electron transport complex subunit RsxC [Lachnospiraceae bacterium]
MSVLTFKGGVHPLGKKELSKTKKIISYLPGSEVVIPVSQHIGAPAEVIVNKGDRVLAGQLIAKANGFISANVHSSVSGEVVAIEDRMVLNDNKCKCIIIKNDDLYEPVPITDFRKPEELTREDIIELVKEAGVVGMGGAGFPTHVKLSPKNPNAIRYIIVNGAECEPYLTSDYRRMLEDADIIVEGLQIVLSMFPKAKGYIAIEDNKLDAIKLLKDKTKKIPNIQVKEVYTKYPQGGERSLIYALTKKEINSSMLPADAGCIVQNIDTIHAIYEAVVNKRPLIDRIVTVTGEAIKKPQNYKVPIGVMYEDLIKEAGGFDKMPPKIVSGGPMMGIALSRTDIPVTKGTSAILCLEKDEAAVKESNCISCGRCLNACPQKLVPTLLAKAATHGDKETFIKLNGMECCECGCCTYACVAKRNLTQSIKSIKKEIIADRRKASS